MKNFLKSILCALPVYILLSLDANGQSKTDCEEIKVEIKSTDTSSDLRNGEIKIVNQQSSQQIKVHILKVGKPDANQYNLEKLEITGLERGEYDVVITEESGRNYCPKLQRINVN